MAKYMGAKMLKKQIEKEQKKAEAMAVRATKKVHGNKTETIDRAKQRFDITSITLKVEELFIDSKENTVNPKFQAAHDFLIKKEQFFYTEDDTLL